MFMMDEIILVRNMLKDDNEIYKNLSKSIAPQVCGHDEIKKGILL
jgi:DNA replicative helicase MCM subunit Mcm2 (Cdc46/Mcm family)